METMIVNLRDVDITDKEYFDEYYRYKNEFIEGFREINSIRTYLPKDARIQNEALEANMKKVDSIRLKQKADELIQLQGLQKHHGELVNHMSKKAENLNYSEFRSLWSPLIWQAQQDNSQAKVAIGDKKIDAFDLDYVLAESLQNLYAEQDPKAEYYDWVEQQQQIETSLNYNGASDEEIAERNSFIAFMDERETEIKRVIFLYSAAAFNPNSRQQKLAQEKIAFMSFKLNELRRIRSRVENTKEKDSQNKEKHQEIQEAENKKVQETFNITSDVLAFAGGVAIAQELINNNQQNNPNFKATQVLERGIGQSLLEQRPSSTTPQEADEKIKNLRLNEKAIGSMLTAMRHGQSKEDWLKEHGYYQSISPKKNIRIPQGWNLNRFKELNEEQNSY